MFSWGKYIEKKRFSKPPIYIGGCGRSGTTLMLSVLSAHKDIFGIPKELNLFEEAKIKNDQISTPRFYRLYRTLIFTKIKKSANRYCEKSPVNIRHIDLINKKNHGNFRMIHMVRDGRDVILSKHPRKKDGYWIDPERWINDVKIGIKQNSDANILMVKYEDLVTDYERTIRIICDFLEIDASVEILKWHSYTNVRKNNALFTEIDRIYDKSINKFMEPENQSRVKQLTNNPEAIDLLKQLGYI